MKRFWNLFLFLILSVAAFGQTTATLTGTIVDKADNEPIIAGSVELLQRKDSVRVVNSISNVRGGFTLKNVRPGNYILRITYLGYLPLTKNVSVQNAQSINLGKLSLEANAILLQEMIVEGKKPEIIVKEDTIEYDAGSYKVTENAAVEDLLKKLPGVEIDKDGKITANGKEIKKIMVDGKEFFSDDPKVASKNLPAEMIEKLQIVDRKSDMARMTGFDDGEEETIINLVVHAGMKKGTMGNAMLGAGADIAVDNNSRYQGTAFINHMNNDGQYTLILGKNNNNNMGAEDLGLGRFNGMRIRRGNGGVATSTMAAFRMNKALNPTLNLNADVRYNGSDRLSQSMVERVSLRQNGSQLDSTFTHNNYLSDNIALNFNLEWKPDTMNTLTIRPNFSFNTSSSTEYEEASLYNFDTPTKLRATESNANNQGKGYNAGGSLDYAHKFSKPGRVFSINAQATYNNSTSWEKSNTDYLHQETSNFPDLNQHSENDNHTNSYRTTLAWVEPLGGNRFLQANYRISHSDTKNINSTYDLDDALLNALLNDSLSRSTVRNSTNQRIGLSFKAVHRQFNYTLGFNVDPNRSINETWQPSTHLADRSSSHYNSRMANVLGDTLISSTLQDIVNFSPTANFTYNFGQRTNLRINYDGETTQPSATQLRDYIDKSRPTNWVEGNPKLKTGYSQNLQIRFQKYVPETQLMYNLNLSGGFSTNDIINITQYLGDSIRITSYDNINGNWNTRLRGMFNQPLKNKHFSIANNITLSYNNRNSLIVEADTLKNTQKTFSFMDNAQFKYTSTLFDVSLDASVNLNDIANSVNRQQNQQTLSVGIGGSTTWYLPYNWTIESNIQYTKRSGTLASYNIPETMWNASLSKQIFNKQAGTGLLKLYIYDILRDRNDITSSATTNGYLTTQANIIPSYVMCSFIYKFKAFPKSSSAREDDFRPRMRGGEGLRRDSFDSFPR